MSVPIQDHLEDDLFGRLVFSAPDIVSFEAKFDEDVGELSLSEALATYVLYTSRWGKSQVWELAGGLNVLEGEDGKWSLFESLLRVERNEHLSAWASFARGTWIERIPSKPGVYPTRALDGRRGKDRELRLIRGRLVDVTGEMVPSGKISTWAGSWWSAPYPSLPGAQ